MDYEVECPKHSGAFDYRTGVAKRLPPCVNLRTYPVRVEGGRVLVEITSAILLVCLANRGRHRRSRRSGPSRRAGSARTRVRRFCPRVGNELHPPYERPPALTINAGGEAGNVRGQNGRFARQGLAQNRTSWRRKAQAPKSRRVATLGIHNTADIIAKRPQFFGESVGDIAMEDGRLQTLPRRLARHGENRARFLRLDRSPRRFQTRRGSASEPTRWSAV